MDTESSVGAEQIFNASNSMSRKKKSVRFQVYDIKNLGSIKQKRQEMENKLDRFSKERSLSGSHRQSSNSRRAVKDKTISAEEESQSFNILSGRSSLNNRSGFNQLAEEEFKENTFGANIIHEVLTKANVVSPKDVSLH